ncbi:uncharacterized protein LOC143300742 [Babylonia areolata]|uniref:uncharacterized protein LOC143300742 n=1 Tax=Babylonia areolata TaxID=304850 RepID=UPI003FD61248
MSQITAQSLLQAALAQARPAEENGTEETGEQNGEQENGEGTHTVAVTPDSPPADASSTAKRRRQSLDDGEPLRKKRRKDVSPAKYFEVTERSPDQSAKVSTKYGCSRCGSLYKWRKSLNKHWKEKHDGDPGDNSPVPQGMKMLLKQQAYRQTEGRRCVHVELLNSITVGVLSPEPETHTADYTVSDIPHGVEKNGLDGEVAGGVTPSAYSTEPLTSSASTPPASDSGSGSGMDNRHLNGPSPVNNHLGDETDGVSGTSSRSPHVTTEAARQELGGEEERPPSSSSTGSSGSLPLAAASPGRTSDLEGELQMLNHLEAAKRGGSRAVLACPRCDVVLTTQTAYSNHLATHMSSAFRHVTKCAVCRLHVRDGHCLNRHFEDNHKHVLSNKVETAKTNGVPRAQATPRSSQLECAICGFMAKWPAELDKHMVSHTDARPWQCVVCGSTYKRIWDHNKHFLKAHPSLSNPYQQRPTQAAGCATQASPSSGDTQHEGQVQGNVAEAGSPSTFLVHHSPTDSGQQQTKSCQVSVTQSDKLKISPQQNTAGKRRHDLVSKDKCDTAQDRPTKQVRRGLYKCTECAFVGVTPTEVTQHMTKHHKAKWFACPHCDYRSRWKSDVNKHLSRCPPGGDINSVVDLRERASPQAPPSTTPEGTAVRSAPSSSRQRSSVRKAAPTAVVSVAQGHQRSVVPSLAASLSSHTATQPRANGLQQLLVKGPAPSRAAPPPPSTLDTTRSSLTASDRRFSAFACESCAFSADRLRTLIEHRSVHRAAGRGERARQSPAVNGKKEVDEARVKHPRKAVREYQCTLCSFACFKNTDFLAHQISVHGKNKCKWCSERWDTKSKYLDHLVSHPEFNPDEWESFFAREDINNNRDDSRVFDKKELLPCQWCTDVFKNVVTLHMHCKRKHPSELNELTAHEGAETDSGTTPRNGEGKTTAHPHSARHGPSVPGARTEVNNSMNQGPCVPGRPDAAAEETVSSDQPDSNELRCWFCGEQLPSFTEVLAHMQAQHSTDLQGVPQHLDHLHHKVNKERAMAKQGLTPSAAHDWIDTKKGHSLRGMPLLLWRDNGQQRYRCMFCTFTHHDPASVVRHANTVRHTIPKKYRCNFCQHYSDDIQEMLRHQEKVHPHQGKSVTKFIWEEITYPDTESDSNTDSSTAHSPLQKCGRAEHPSRSTPKIILPKPVTHLLTTPVAHTFPQLVTEFYPAPTTPSSDEGDDLPLDLSTPVTGVSTSKSAGQLPPISEINRSLLTKDRIRSPVTNRSSVQPQAHEALKAETDNESGNAESESEVRDVKVVLNCKHCPFSCFEMYDLRTHSRYHGLKGQYSCEYCTFSHEDFTTLREHRSLHSSKEQKKAE